MGLQPAVWLVAAHPLTPSRLRARCVPGNRLVMCPRKHRTRICRTRKLEANVRNLLSGAGFGSTMSGAALGAEGVQGVGFMKQCRVTVAVGLLLAAVLANAAAKNNVIRIRILDSETHSVVTDDSGVPKNCDPTNFDAYCHNSKTSLVTNTLLVQEGGKPPFRVSCTIEAKFSRCVPLPKGESYDAKVEKRGLTIYYADDNGKPRKQFYAMTGSPLQANTDSPASAAAAPAATVAPAAPAAPPAASPVQAAAPAQASGGAVKCNFNSAPAGAEITLDGQYVGSTPSVVNIATGAHTVQISLPGFAVWKRDLTVSPGSELTVNALLEKAQ